MKTVIQNYSSPLSTEPIYFQKTLQNFGIESVIWNRSQISIFDILDRVQPDLYITHHAHLQMDVLKYLSGSKIDVVLNVTDIQPGQVKILEEVLKQYKIKVPFVFYNEIDGSHLAGFNGFKSHSILPAADLFTPAGSDLDFELDAIRIYLGDMDYDFGQSHDTYHNVTIKERPNYDFQASVVNLMPLYLKYKQICLIGRPEDIFSQIMFDSMIRHRNVSLLSSNDEKMKSLMGLFKSDNIQEEIKRKHTCLNRTARLLEKLGVQFNRQILDQMIGII